MPDTPLTSLCSICHAAPPKYRCPACGARTCSLACVRKHKDWAGCGGARDPAAYVPRARLRTPAGVDHDFNFLAAIERGRERAERAVVHGAGLLAESDLRGPKVGEDRRFEKVWYGDRLHHVPAASRGGGRGGYGRPRGRARLVTEGRSLDKQVRRRLRDHDIEVLLMPRGLSRQKENKTAWNRRTNTINFMVEWFVVGVDGLKLEKPVEKDGSTRILHKALDGTPLHQAFADSLDWVRAGTKRALEADDEGVDGEPQQNPRKRRRSAWKKKRAQEEDDAAATSAMQDQQSTTWPRTEYIFQSYHTSHWSQMGTSSSLPRTKDEEIAELAKLQFFLLSADPSSGSSKPLTPLSGTSSLLDVLSGRTVLEFPTIYVLGPGKPLPSGFSLASIARREQRQESTSEGEISRPRTHLGQRQFDRRRGGFARHNGYQRRVAFTPHDDESEEGEIKSGPEPLDADVVEESESTSGEEQLVLGDDDSSSADFENGDKSEVPRNDGLEQRHLAPKPGLVDYGSSSDDDAVDEHMEG